jgi:hypothetical protein
MEYKQNNYKENLAGNWMIKREGERRGQVAVYVIIAAVIVVGVILVYFLYPDAITGVLGGRESPSDFLESEIEPAVRNSVEILSKQGGYEDPEGYIMYKGSRVKYLCYTSKYYEPCQVQQPMIKAKFEKELTNMIQDKVEESVDNLIETYERRGYSVSSISRPTTEVEIVIGKIIVKVKAPMTFTKESTETFNEFNIEIESNMYNLLMIATSIIDFESTLGDSETSMYTAYYPDLRIRKNKLGDGSTVYVVEDVITKESFMFASRALAWPAGYGIYG